MSVGVYWNKRIIKHDRSMDIMFSVLNSTWTKDGYDLKGIWLNMGFTSKAKCNWIISPTGRRDGVFITHILIKHEDVYNWKYCLNKDGDCLRYEKWATIC